MSKKFTGNILTPEHTIKYGTIEYDGGRVISAEAKSDPVDGEAYILPGLTDIHSHGCMGHDTCDADVDALIKMAEFQREQGVTSYFPTTMTFDEERLAATVAAVARAAKETPIIKGIYLEGPFISAEKRGAQNSKYITRPDIGMLGRLQKRAEGMIRFVALAPEVDGAAEFILAARSSADYDIGKIHLSIAHTNSDYETASWAIKNGMTHATHLFNAMPAYNHREPGAVGAIFDSDATVEIISDGIHIHPAVIRNTFKTLGADRICLISDSCEAAGMPDGEYELGGRPVRKTGRLATMERGSVIAGSASTLYECLVFAVKEAGIPLEQAIVSASITPAREAGISPEGLLILEPDLNIKEVIF